MLRRCEEGHSISLGISRIREEGADLRRRGILFSESAGKGFSLYQNWTAEQY